MHHNKYMDYNLLSDLSSSYASSITNKHTHKLAYKPSKPVIRVNMLYNYTLNKFAMRPSNRVQTIIYI